MFCKFEKLGLKLSSLISLCDSSKYKLPFGLLTGDISSTSPVGCTYVPLFLSVYFIKIIIFNYREVDLLRFFMRCDHIDEDLIDVLHDRLLKNIEVLYYLTSPSKRMLKDMGIYEGDIDYVISIIVDDFTDIAELQKLLVENQLRLKKVSIVSRFVMNRLINN